jgi:hypothetical protein
LLAVTVWVVCVELLVAIVLLLQRNELWKEQGNKKTLAPSQTLKGREFYFYSRGATLIAFFISISISCEKPALATPDATTVKLS